MPAIRGTGLPLTLGQTITNEETLAAGHARILPAGYLHVGVGQYSHIEYLDPISQIWRLFPVNTTRTWFGYSDGVNLRIINRTGCAVGALVSNHGSNYTAPTCTTGGSGGAVFKAIVGGMISASVTVVSGGSGYTYPPRVVIPAPPVGGIQATAHCALTNGVVSSVTIDNQGAGYSGTVQCQFATDPNDPSTNVVAASPITLTITGSGQISAVVCTNPGSPVTSVPSITITDPTGSSATATALMCFSVTGYTVSAGGTGFNAGTFLTSSGGILTTAEVNTNPAIEQGIIIPRPVKLVPALSAGVIVASGTTAPTGVEDWGWGFQLAPTLVPVDGQGLATGAATGITATVGGQNDTIWVQQLVG